MLEFVINENQVIGVVPLALQKTFAPVDEEVE
jgi:hypothetical protein